VDIYQYWIDLSSCEGEVKVQVRSADLVGNEETPHIKEYFIMKTKENQPPIPIIKFPLNGTEHYTGEQVLLDATGTYDDSMGPYFPIKLSWFSNIDGFLGSGGVISVTLTKGEHVITLYADDGAPDHNVSTSVEISVKGPSPDGNENPNDPPVGGDDDQSYILVLVVLGIASILVISVITLMVIHRRTKSKEVRIDINGSGDESSLDDPRSI
jgi:hypothetical protein